MSPGAYFAAGPCYICKRNFAFDPDTVPSFVVEPVEDRVISEPDDPGMLRAQREPVCYGCAEAVALVRAQRGLEDLVARPVGHPDMSDDIFVDHLTGRASTRGCCRDGVVIGLRS